MEWTRGPTIGRGSSAAVSLASTTTGQLFAVKSVDISSSTLLQNEQHLISQLCSPFVVECFGSDITRENNKSFYNIFFEYFPGGTLSDLIRNHGGSLDENTIQFYTHQMLKGLSYLHMEGVVHCDIKGQNILIGKDGLKIADFGCAKWAECEGSAKPAFAGTPAYMAPEVARGEEQSFPADIWALGCTVIEMATGSNPWPEMKDPASALYRVAYSDDVPEIPTWFSGAAKDFLEKSLRRNLRERWTAAELLHHPFLDSSEANCAEIRECTKKSPTSVIDQHFWDVLEVPDPSADPTENPCHSDYPAGRIRDLIGYYGALNIAEWREEEDWVTVRGNETEECLKSYCTNEDSIDEDHITGYSIDEEEIETSIFMGNSIFNSFIDEISTVNIVSYEIDDSVSRIVTFDGTVRKNSFDCDRLLLQTLRVPFFSGVFLQFWKVYFEEMRVGFTKN